MAFTLLIARLFMLGMHKKKTNKALHVITNQHSKGLPRNEENARYCILCTWIGISFEIL
jgi:hypothetical protein